MNRYSEQYRTACDRERQRTGAGRTGRSAGRHAVLPLRKLGGGGTDDLPSPCSRSAPADGNRGQLGYPVAALFSGGE